MIAKRATAALFAALLTTGCALGPGVASAIPPSPTVASSTAATASPAPSTSASPIQASALPVGHLDAGVTYALDVERPHQILVTVPADGWFTIDTWFLGKDVLPPSDSFDMTLLPYLVGNVFLDPCHWLAGAVDPPVGPTVADLTTALVKQAGPAAVPPTDVTLGGFAGKKVELSIPKDVDTAGCHEGDYGRWSTADDPAHPAPFTYGNRQHDTVYIVDVRGTRWVIDTNFQPGTSAANLAELDQLVASIRFEP
jgi:hypothetical protein